jgi:hypothetical protein
MRDLLTGKAVQLEIHDGSVAFPLPATSAYVLVPGGG